MKLRIIADHVEGVVNATQVGLTCPNCATNFQVVCTDLLREANLAANDITQNQLAQAEYIQAYETSITCVACEIAFPVDFAYGEMQPARYKLGLFG